MTAQTREKLLYEGRVVWMCSEPLRDYFALGGRKVEFEFTCTALWRGYVGTWEITGSRLYLIGLKGTLKGGAKASLETVFPGYADRVFAHWFSGSLRIPEGQMLEYVHMGYESTYEQDRFIDIDKGVLVGHRLTHHGVAEGADGPVAYGIAGMTLFPGREDGDGRK